MAPNTPNVAAHEALDPLSSRFVSVDSLSWTETQYPGLSMKTLVTDPETGLVTGLFKFEPGAKIPFHEHVAIEQTYVIEGSLTDHEGTAKKGDFVWRPAGNQHEAWSEDGCIVLSIFLKPNKFFLDEGEKIGWDKD